MQIYILLLESFFNRHCSAVLQCTTSHICTSKYLYLLAYTFIIQDNPILARKNCIFWSSSRFFQRLSPFGPFAQFLVPSNALKRLLGHLHIQILQLAFNYFFPPTHIREYLLQQSRVTLLTSLKMTTFVHTYCKMPLLAFPSKKARESL